MNHMKRTSMLLILSLLSVLMNGQVLFSTRIIHSADDAEEKYDGSYITATSSDLELMYDTWNNQGLQTIGLRFVNVLIPSNATINNAYIQFTADGSTSGEIELIIEGENSAFPEAYIHGSGSPGNISLRPRTVENVVWRSIPSWSNNQSGPAQKTPDLSALVHEIITANGWQSGNPVAFIITGNGGPGLLRRAYSFDSGALLAAELIIEYTTTFEVDMSVNSIVSPPSGFVFPNPEYPIVAELFNYGSQPANNYTVSYYINGLLQQNQQGAQTIQPGEGLIFTFDQPANFNTLGTYNLLVAVNIPGDEFPANNQFSAEVTVVNETDPLFFSAGSAWRYWDGSVDPGALWTTDGYDDSNWLVGAGHIGFGDGDELTLLTPGNARYCFRKSVIIDNIDELEDVYFHLTHDDGAVIFINGQEVFRTELMPLTNITHSTTARQRINNDIENSFFTYKISSSSFVQGENQIAISVHNVSTSDADLSFDCFITPAYTYSQDGPYVFYQSGQIIVSEVTPEGLVTNTYSSLEGVELTCHIPQMNKSFSFTLKPELQNEPAVYPQTPSRYFVISDFDSHFEGFTMALLNEGVIDEDFNWIYGDGHLIINGDVFDRGENTSESLWLIYKLESESLAAGGKVHFIMGNHEMFNMKDDWRYVEVKYFNNAQLMGKRMEELYSADTEIGRWLRTKNIIEKLGDYLLVHGGISPQVAAMNATFEQLNEYGRRQMNNQTCTGDCAIATGSNGLYWYRGMADEELSQQQVDEILDGYDAFRIIIGHTKANTIRVLYQQRVVAIDIYHGNNYANGFMEALQFEEGCFNRFITTSSSNTYLQMGECDEFTVKLDENTLSLLKFWPNPASDKLYVSLPELLPVNHTYSIFSAHGQLVQQGILQQGESSLDLSQLSKGLFILQLEADRQRVRHKLIRK
jgi:calcineurin-like phosphoesterase family protein